MVQGDGERRSRSRTVERLRKRAEGPREFGETMRESSNKLMVTRVGGARVHNGGSGGARVQVWVSGSLSSRTSKVSV
jgi:hypothetical protein